MAELFSKEYLKDLMTSGSLEGAAKTTAKAGLESLSSRVAQGGGEELSFADKILNGGDGFVRDIAQEAITQASHTIDQQASTEQSDNTTGAEGDETVMHADFSPSNLASEKNDSGLFSSNYLQNLLESDNMQDLINKKFDADIPLDDLAQQANTLISERSSQTANAWEAPNSHAVYEGLDQSGTVFTAADGRQYVLGNADMPQYTAPQYPPPPASGQYTRSVQAPAPVPHELQPKKQNKSNKKQNRTQDSGSTQVEKTSRSGKVIMVAIMALIVFALAANTCNSNDTSSPSKSSSSSTQTKVSGPIQFDVREVIAFGTVVDNEGAIEYLLVNNQTKLDEVDIDDALGHRLNGLMGSPFVIVEDEKGRYWAADGLGIHFRDDETSEVILSEYFEDRLDYIALPKSSIAVWYPNAQKIPKMDTYQRLDMVLEQGVQVGGYLHNRDYGYHKDGICPNGMLLLQSLTSFGDMREYWVVDVCGCDGAIVYSSEQFPQINNNDTVYLPPELEPAGDGV